MNEIIILAVVGAPAVALAITLYWVDRQRRSAALFRWSASNGYQLLSYHQPLLTEASGFPFTISKSQHVFRVDVKTPDGEQRSGWVRLGSAWRGISSNKVDVRWDHKDS